MENLLKETKYAIEKTKHKINDIIFIGSEESGHCCSWKQFEKLADVYYDEGYGAPKVALDLVIVFNDGSRLWRDEYDGSEYWQYFPPFKMPKELKPIYRLTVIGTDKVGWVTLKELNENSEKGTENEK